MTRKHSLEFMIMVGVLILSAGTALAQEAEQVPTAEAKIDINVASLEELQTLPGITAQIAEAIVAKRPYADVEELLKIAGISEGVFAQIEGMIEATKLNINYATQEELMTLPGVSAEVAKIIMMGRPYFTLEDLLNAEGMNEETFVAIQNYVIASLEKKSRATRGSDKDKDDKDR